MIGNLFERVFAGIARHRRATLALAAAAMLGGLATLWSTPLDNDIALMLPKDTDVQRSMAFLRDSNLSDKVIVSLEVEPGAGGLDALLTAVSQLEHRLGPPLVTSVEAGVRGQSLSTDLQTLIERTPQLLTTAELEEIDAQLDAEGIDAMLRRNYRQLIGPGEMFAKETIRRDPFGLSAKYLSLIQNLSSSIGYRVEIESGRFVSADRRHALLLLDTPVEITDSAGGRELFRLLRDEIRALPDGIDASVVAGHLHTISNEDVIQRDVLVGLSAASLGFLVLFVWLYRDPRAVVLFLLPVASVVIAIGLAGLVAGSLSAFVVGMGGVVAGIAIDYAIHVYMAIRAANGEISAVRHVAGPIATGALTTLGVFLAFLFSSVPGYRQLATFSIASIGICVLASLFILPLLVGGEGRLRAPSRAWADVPHYSTMLRRLAVGIWGAAMLLGLLHVGSLEIRTDLLQFDGSQPYVLDAEADFERVWGGDGQPAVLVATGPTLDDALSQNRALHTEIVERLGQEKFTSLAPIWPPGAIRATNESRWRSFWRDGRKERLVELLAAGAPSYGFSSAAFGPFLSGIGKRSSPEELAASPFPSITDRFTRRVDGGYQVFSFFPDESSWLDTVGAIASGHAGAFVVSRNGLADGLAGSITSEVRRLGAIAVVFLPILAFVLLRDVRLTLLSLVPVASSLVAVLGIPAALGSAMTAPGMIAAMIVVGLSIDYGIFIVHACATSERTATAAAVTLSAVSTLIGTGALVLSEHPVLFSVGSTMVTGITAGYAAAIMVVPALYEGIVAPVRSR